MNSVHILGIGMTKLGRHPDKSVKALTAEAVRRALEDAGCEVVDIGAAWFANTRQPMLEGQNTIRGQIALRAAGLSGVPIFNVENACASGSSAVALAHAYIQSGAIDIALVAGAEKMYFPDRRDKMTAAFLGGTDIDALDETQDRFRAMGNSLVPLEHQHEGNPHSIFMDIYAGLARFHMEAFGTTQRQIAAAAAKNHWHSTMNPLAQYRHDMTVEEVLSDVMVSWPLTRSMCAPVTDGAAALILCSDRALARLGNAGSVRIRGIGISSGTPREAADLDHHCGKVAADRAYTMAAIGPSDIHVAEVHDASAFAELLQVENLGFCARGESGPMTERKETQLGGRIPVNPSGGLVSKGHPIGATGIIQLHEIVTQLRGGAGRRQVESARIGIAENGGGFLGVEEASCVVTILEKNS